MKTLLLAIVLIVAVVGTTAAEEFTLDTGHTEIRFSALHFGVSQLGGWFTEASGGVNLNQEDLTQSSVEITIQTNSLTATSPQRQEALVSGFFLDTEKYPTISFASTKVEQSDDGLVLTGNLTIKETTKEVSFPFTLLGPMADPFGGTRLGVMGSVTVNRRDFGVLFDRKMKSGVPLVGDDITISLSAEFAQAPVKEEEN